VTGSIFYTAPEMIKDNTYDYKADVFSIGVLFFWLLTGQYPYCQVTDEGFVKCLQGNIEHIALLDSSPEKITLVILQMLHYNPEQRCSIQVVNSCMWFTEMEKLSYKQMRSLVM